jgi:hypothetical protein
MRTNLNIRGWRRVAATVAVAALPLGIVALTDGAASAFAPTGSVGEVFIDSTASGSLADALPSGFWGHEGGSGGTGTGTSFLDTNLSDPAVAAAFPDTSKVGVAFVTTSANGSAEHPTGTAGQTVDQVFGAGSWFMDAGIDTGLNGTTNANDSVATVSTGAEYDAWVTAGSPTQGYDNSLVLHDLGGTNPVSAAPKGKSILNRWPAGSHISLVFYRTTGATVNGKPVVYLDGTGHAVTEWMPFVTSAKPGDAIRTSAGWTAPDFGAIPEATTTTLTTSVPGPVSSGTPVDLTATVAPTSGTDVPVGHVQFMDGSSNLGSPVALTGGVAHLNAQVLPVGTHSLTAVFVNDANTSTLAFTASTSSAVSFTVNKIGTTTAAGATPGADYTVAVPLTASVTPAGVTGSVTWFEGSTPIAGPSTVDNTGAATGSHTFTVGGSHTITAVFTPDSSSPNYAGSTSSPVTFSLNNPSNVSVDPQSITATIPAGSLVVSTPYTPTNPLNITGTGPSGALALNTATDVPGATALTGFFGTANFQHINVFDTRSGAKAWTLTAQSTGLTSGANSINGENLGLTNVVPETANTAPNRNNNPGLGTILVTNNPVSTSPKSPSDTGSAGLGGIPHTVLAENFGPADAWYSGLLTLFAPTTTPSGLYTGTITFTAS